jgi:hypothetical protein
MKNKITLEDLAKVKEHKRNYQMAVATGSDTVDNAIDLSERTIWFTAVSEDNKGMRETWSGVRYIEEIDVATVNVDNWRIFIKDHTPSTDNVIGRIVETLKEDGKLKAKVRFSETAPASDVFRKYQEGILTDVSIGYRYDLNDATIIDDDVPLVILRNVEVFELSSVWQGFDSGAKLGRDADAKVEDAVLPTLELEEGEVEGGCDAFLVAERIKLMRRNLKLKIKTGDSI